MRKVDGREMLAADPVDRSIDLVAQSNSGIMPGDHSTADSNDIPEGTKPAIG
jgi:hypothetical protein